MHMKNLVLEKARRNRTKDSLKEKLKAIGQYTSKKPIFERKC